MKLGTPILYVSHGGELVPGVTTAAFDQNRINAFLFTDGVNHAHILPHVYTVDYAPVRPDGTMSPNSWHYP